MSLYYLLFSPYLAFLSVLSFCNKILLAKLFSRYLGCNTSNNFSIALNQYLQPLFKFVHSINNVFRVRLFRSKILHSKVFLSSCKKSTIRFLKTPKKYFVKLTSMVCINFQNKSMRELSILCHL